MKSSNELLKIGELAKRSGVSPRTIDYYTSLGLIKPAQRSDSNYRLYGDETILRLKRIEEMKKEKYTLEEIKASLKQWKRVSREENITFKLTALQVHLNQLEKEVNELNPIINNLKPHQVRRLLQNITPHSNACMKAFMLLFGTDAMLDFEEINKIFTP